MLLDGFLFLDQDSGRKRGSGGSCVIDPASRARTVSRLADFGLREKLFRTL
jgi:hypothetical protein